MRRKKNIAPARPKPKPPTDSEMLEEILRMIHARLQDGEFEPKVADFLKVLETKHKLKLAANEKERLLEIIEKARKDELGEPPNARQPAADSDKSD